MEEILKETDTLNVPILNIADMVGDTGYIDFIKASDMNNPVMKGIDTFGRQFLSIKVEYQKKCVDKETEKTIIKKGELVSTFFQRYSGCESTVCYGTYYQYSNIFYESYISLKNINIVISRIKKLLHGEIIKNINYDNSLTQDELICGNGKLLMYIPNIRNKIQTVVSNEIYNDISSIIMSYI
jgi:hypothetical protein